MRDQGPAIVCTKLQRVAEMSKRISGEALTTLAHHIDLEFLKEAYRRTRKDGASGVDGKTAEEYAANLETNLESLLDRFKAGTYRAPPVRRVHIPKGDGEKTRPIGIPTFEDKILQRAVTMILEAVYEQEFLPCSYGFRPKRSVHDAIEALWKELEGVRGGWVLEVDIQDFFGTLNHRQLREILDQRVRDGVLRRTINKWLKAGVLEDGVLMRSDLGTPQGGVVSPILANIYLHAVIDEWFERDVRPRLRGRAALFRYADDITMVFACEEDVRRVLEVLPKRLAKYGLTLHPEKTRLIDFARPKERSTNGDQDSRRPGSFDFLGFKHYWGRSRKGRSTVKRKTSSKRFTRSLRKVYEWCKTHRHWRICDQHKALSQKLLGHYSFYGITGNFPAIGCFYEEVKRVWQKWLNRRSQKRTMPWERMSKLLKRYPLPRPRVVHSTISHAARP